MVVEETLHPAVSESGSGGGGAARGGDGDDDAGVISVNLGRTAQQPSRNTRGLNSGVPSKSNGGGNDFAVSEEDSCPACTGEAGDDVGIACTVDIAHFVRVLALFPFSQRYGAESAVGVG